MSTAQSSGATRSSALPRHRNRWITTGAVILIAEGGLAILSAPILTTTSGWPVQSVLLPVVALGVLNVAIGVGLVGARAWARAAAGILSALTLALMYVPALTVAVANDVWIGFDWLGILCYAFVLFAVLRRWPSGTSGSVTP